MSEAIPAVSGRQRRHDLDNVRTCLTDLVIYHHTALAYGGPGSWVYKSKYFGGLSLPLVAFNAINQSFFMGNLFWLSGHLTAQGLAKDSTWSGRARFAMGKWLRLGLPASVYTVFMQPSLYAILQLSRGQSPSFAWLSNLYKNYWSGLNSARGPVWYLATLLSFDILSTLLVPKSSPRLVRALKSRSFRRYVIPASWIFATASSFLLRQNYPVGTCMPFIGAQQGYIPQYILAYILGQISYLTRTPTLLTPFNAATTSLDEKSEAAPLDSGEDTTLPAMTLSSAITASVLTFPLIFLPDLLSNHSLKSAIYNTLENSRGGSWNLPSLLYCLWNETSFALIGPALIEHFTRYHNQASSSWLWRARYSYAAFLVHPVVSVGIEALADKPLGWISTGKDMGEVARMIGSLTMTAVVGSVNVVASMGLGKVLIDYVPAVSKVL